MSYSGSREKSEFGIWRSDLQWQPCSFGIINLHAVHLTYASILHWWNFWDSAYLNLKSISLCMCYPYKYAWQIVIGELFPNIKLYSRPMKLFCSNDCQCVPQVQWNWYLHPHCVITCSFSDEMHALNVDHIQATERFGRPFPLYWHHCPPLPELWPHLYLIYPSWEFAPSSDCPLPSQHVFKIMPLSSVREAPQHDISFSMWKQIT